MKILIDARLYGLENAGLGRYINNLVENLVKLGSENEYYILLRKKYFDELELPKNWEKVLADFRHYSVREQLLLPLIINKIKPDMVHFPHFNVPIFYNGKFIVTIHDTLMHEQRGLEATTLAAPIYLIKRFAYSLVFNAAISKSKKIIVPSEAVKKDLLSRYNIPDEKIEITYEGVDEKIVHKNVPHIKKPYFIYIGNAYPHKNLSRLIEAMAVLNNANKQKINLVIVSARSVFTEKLRGLISKFKAKDFVRIIGFVDDEDLGSLLHSSEAFIFPSLSEGFGLPGLEAMKSSTLVLASDIPVFREIYKDNAIYFDPVNLGSMINAMTEVLEMKLKDKQKRIESGEKFTDNYSWQNMTERTLEIYKESLR